MSVPVPAWARLSEDGRGLLLTVYVQPNARASAFAGIHGDALKVRVAAPATDDRANRALLEFLRHALGVSRAAVRIVHGRTARRKIIAVTGSSLQLAALIRRLTEGAT